LSQSTSVPKWNQNRMRMYSPLGCQPGGFARFTSSRTSSWNASTGRRATATRMKALNARAGAVRPADDGLSALLARCVCERAAAARDAPELTGVPVLRRAPVRAGVSPLALANLDRETAAPDTACCEPMPDAPAADEGTSNPARGMVKSTPSHASVRRVARARALIARLPKPPTSATVGTALLQR